MRKMSQNHPIVQGRRIQARAGRRIQDWYRQSEEAVAGTWSGEEFAVRFSDVVSLVIHLVTQDQANPHSHQREGWSAAAFLTRTGD